MAVATPPRQGERAPGDGPEQGVIEEARRRRRARLVRSAVLASAALAALAAVVLAESRGGAAQRPPLRIPPEPARRSAAALAAASPQGVAVRVVPDLQGAEAGWEVEIVQGGGVTGAGGRLPTPGNPIVSGTSGWSYGERSDTTVIVTAPDVARVRFSDGRAVPTTPEPGLPYGMRVAVMRTPHHEGRPTRATTIRPTGFENAAGQSVVEGKVRGSGLQWRIWNPPAKPSRGACALHAAAGYATEWGQVAAALRPYPAQIYGRAFVSCIDTEYFPKGCDSPECGVRAAVLLDAANPARVSPAPLPGVEPISGLPGYVNTAPDYGLEQLTARRDGNAWLVAELGGEHGEAARIRLLRGLSFTISPVPKQ